MLEVQKKILAQELRQKGKSISEIAELLGMQKSGTISKWCRDITLSPDQIEVLSKKQKSGSYKGRIIAVENLRKKRLKEVSLLKQEGLKEIGKINRRDLLVCGAGIYWSEGETCSTSDNVCFTNSDPKMVILMLRWFKEICRVRNDKFSLQLRVNETHAKRIKELENYWSKTTDIPLAQFTKTILIKAKTKRDYPNPEAYLGTLRILVHEGTRLRRKINGWLAGLMGNI